MDWIRTDLAEELRGRAMEQSAREKKGELDGVVYEEETQGRLRTSRIKILNGQGEKTIGKAKGSYVTISFPAAGELSYEEFTSLSDLLAREIRALAGERESVLVAGLGNDRFAADALGVIAVRHTLVTHHLKGNEAFSAFGDIAAVTPGIMAKTGMESAELIAGAVKSVSPSLVIAIDAMAAREAGRLARTVQLCNTGIFPGAGLGNHRRELSEKTLGVPVLAIGVPTAVDAATLVYDALEGQRIDEKSMEKLSGFFVCPKDIDLVAELLGKLIGHAINRAFHGDISYEEMEMLT